MRNLLSAFLLLLTLSIRAAAQTPRQNSCTERLLRSEPNPSKACIGVYVVRLSEIDLKTQSFFADFYLWMRWRGDESLGRLEIVNGDTLTYSQDYKDTFDGFHYTYTHVQGRLRSKFDLQNYPLDEHHLMIEIESSFTSNDQLQLIPDDEIGVSPMIEVPGWELGRYEAAALPFTYPTDFGDLREDRQTIYSRFQFRIPVHRPKLKVYLKTFLALFISVAIGLVSCVLKATNLESRLGIGVASIFGVVSSHLVVEQNLPESAQFTTADHIHIAAMVMVFLSVLWSAVVYRVAMSQRKELAERLDNIVGAFLVVGFTAAVIWLSWV